MDWFKKNWKTLLPLVTVLASVVGGILGVKLTIKTDPDVKTPEVVVIFPEGTDPIPVQGVVGGPLDALRDGMLRIRVRAASEFADEQGWKGAAGWVRAWRAVAKVKNEDVKAAAIKAGFVEPVGALGDGEIFKALIAWFSDPANQEKIKAFIKFLIEMAMLFAHAGDWANYFAVMDLLAAFGQSIG